MAGETLGCTAPVIPACDALVFVADGRFHLEAAMIRNPSLKAYRYDPYSKILSIETYDTVAMKHQRWLSSKYVEQFCVLFIMRFWNRSAIEKSRSCTNFGIVLGIFTYKTIECFEGLFLIPTPVTGTLGRQGNNALFEKMKLKAENKGKNVFLFLMAELNPAKLALFSFIDVSFSSFLLYALNLSFPKI